ncbi:unnamed protein product [Pleuronectes platessa]|uniref:Uncharacterized protein n=1 Tax=Pleuronectes platessa TaxID=8262 RepID=A0A9N7UF75_PLEPL|nr:unnamed protein product [Pleuronectes platessa]
MFHSLTPPGSGLHLQPTHSSQLRDRVSVRVKVIPSARLQQDLLVCLLLGPETWRHPTRTLHDHEQRVTEVEEHGDEERRCFQPSTSIAALNESSRASRASSNRSQRRSEASHLTPGQFFCLLRLRRHPAVRSTPLSTRWSTNTPGRSGPRPVHSARRRRWSGGAGVGAPPSPPPPPTTTTSTSSQCCWSGGAVAVTVRHQAEATTVQQLSFLHSQMEMMGPHPSADLTDGSDTVSQHYDHTRWAQFEHQCVSVIELMCRPLI